MEDLPALFKAQLKHSLVDVAALENHICMVQEEGLISVNTDVNL